MMSKLVEANRGIYCRCQLQNLAHPAWSDLLLNLWGLNKLNTGWTKERIMLPKNILLHNLQIGFQYPNYFCPLFQISLYPGDHRLYRDSFVKLVHYRSSVRKYTAMRVNDVLPQQDKSKITFVVTFDIGNANLISKSKIVIDCLLLLAKLQDMLDTLWVKISNWGLLSEI